MLKKINRKDCIAQYPKFPRSDNFKEDFYFPTIVHGYIFTIQSKSAKTHLKNLSVGITKLMKGLEIDALIFLGDTEKPWLYQQNNYSPANQAYEFLVNKKVGKKFNGGFQIDLNELPLFTSHLSWLARCNAAFPIVHFSDKEQNFIGSICQHGNLHFYSLNEMSDGRLNDIIGKTRFKLLKGQECSDQFSKRAGIKGRETIV
jgi:hypothetical protein